MNTRIHATKTRNAVNRKPLIIALLVVLVYAGYLTVPVFFLPISEDIGDLGIPRAIAMLPGELIAAAALILFLSFSRWWPKVGFQPINPGGLKFLLPPLVLIVGWVAVVNAISPDGPGLLGLTDIGQFLALLSTVLLLGFNEEMIFRGICFYGIGSVVSPLATVFLAALLFGLFHFVNLLTGQDFVTTSYQALHAVAAGFMYGTLRLRIGAIWPVMLFHGVWDMGLFASQTIHASTASASASTPELHFSALVALGIVLPAALYGLFVCWRWSVWGRRDQAANTV